MIKAPISLQDLRRRIYAKAKAEPQWRFWGLYVHVCKMETLREAYAMAKANDGAPGIDGVTFEAIEQGDVSAYLEQIRDELVSGTYRPMRGRTKEIPKGGGKTRVLSIPSIRDRVVQGALKLVLEPIFEADFQPGSYGYRPKRHAHQAIREVVDAIFKGKTRVIDIDLRAYFDNVRQDLLLAKVAKRVDDPKALELLKRIMKASGKKGVPQGGVISPVLSNLYLDQVDRMLERAQKVTREGRFDRVQYARYADDLVVLVDGHPKHEKLLAQVNQRIREELVKLRVEINEEKSRMVDLAKDGSFGFLGFDFRRIPTRNGKWRPHMTPKLTKRTALLSKLSDTFRQHRSQPLERVVQRINPVLRGWVGYFAVGHSGRTFTYIRDWVNKKIRRHLMRAQKRNGFGWKRWSTQWINGKHGLFNEYRRKPLPPRKALPSR